MASAQRNSFFTSYGQHFPDPQQLLPGYSSIPQIIDVLNRREHHHVIACGMTSYLTQLAIAETLAFYLPETECIYFDVTRFMLSAEKPEHIEHAFDELHKTNKKIILMLNQLEPLLAKNPLSKYIQFFLTHPEWRIIAFTKSTPEQELPFFSAIQLPQISKTESLTILKAQRTKLEAFHHTIISDEIITSAFSITNHFLNNKTPLDAALQLLDSAASRARNAELTDKILTETLSTWTYIPVTHLLNNIFKTTHFIETLQQRIHSQDAAITAIGNALQRAYIKLEEKQKPFCCFLFSGPSNVGKTKLAHALADYLFSHKNALIHFDMTQINEHDIIEAVQRMPYAIVLLENINPAIITLSHPAFRHAIIIATTSIGAERLIQYHTTNETAPMIDLMQLILIEPPHDATRTIQHLSASELCEHITPELNAHFSEDFLNYFTIIPFVPLDHSALEKIIRTKLNQLTTHLKTNFEIELNYAPEIIKFLMNETANQINKLDKIFEQHVYACITHEILLQREDKNRPKQLLIQVNHNGQLLRCEFATTLFPPLPERSEGRGAGVRV